MIRKTLLAAVLTCGMTTTYAAERPSEFYLLSPSSIAMACALQVGKGAYETEANPATQSEDKAERIYQLLVLHQVWVAISNADKSDLPEITRVSEKIYGENQTLRSSATKYCIQEGAAGYANLSTERKLKSALKLASFRRKNLSTKGMTNIHYVPHALKERRDTQGHALRAKAGWEQAGLAA